jgi:hypothetical protein
MPQSIKRAEVPPTKARSKATAKKSVVTVLSAPVKRPSKAVLKTTPTRPNLAVKKRKVSAKPSSELPVAPKSVDVVPEAMQAKEKKVKVIRDSFTFPKSEYDQLATLKERALGLGVSVKKGELLRCGLALLAATSDKSFKTTISSLPKLKTGRPRK